jgi:hypothetical protein
MAASLEPPRRFPVNLLHRIAVAWIRQTLLRLFPASDECLHRAAPVFQRPQVIQRLRERIEPVVVRRRRERTYFVEKLLDPGLIRGQVWCG